MIKRVQGYDSLFTEMPTQEYERKIQDIPCNPEVTHVDINRYVERCSAEGCSLCRHVMQRARMIATGAPPSCRKNLEMTCYAEHFSLRFWSGDRGNKVVVLVDGGNICFVVEQRTWQQSIRDLFKRVWEQLCRIKLMIVERMPLPNFASSTSFQLLPKSDTSVNLNDFHNLKTGIFYKTS